MRFTWKNTDFFKVVYKRAMWTEVVCVCVLKYVCVCVLKERECVCVCVDRQISSSS